MTVEWIDTADAAKMIRKALKAKFPGTKFRVRISRYSGGSSIDISWKDGPTQKAVDAIVGPYQGKGFDGSIDMAYYNDSILLADGTVIFGGTEGTEGSMGYVSAQKVELPVGARRVHFGCWVHTNREYSPEAMKQGLEKVIEQYGNQIGLPGNLADAIKVSDHGGYAYIDREYSEKDVTGEKGWNMHWSLGYVAGRIMQETSYA